MSAQKFIPLESLIKLDGKVAVVTGGAAGIGFAVCYRLCEAGAFVYIVDIDDEKAGQSLDELKAKGFNATYIHCDITKEKEVRSMVSAINAEKTRIDILVNNAGIFPRSNLEETTLEQFNKVISVNLAGAFLCSREAARSMLSAGRGGSIINLASIDAVHPSSTGMAAYDASKGAILSMTKSLALELGRHDIRVNAVAPGGILSDNLKTLMATGATSEGKNQLKSFMSRMPLGRMGRPDDIARVVLFLASDLSGYMTGSMVVIDGGYLIT